MTTKEDIHETVIRQFGDWVLYLNGDIEYRKDPYTRYVPSQDIQKYNADQLVTHFERKTWWTMELSENLTSIISAGWRLKEYLDERR